MAVSQAGYDNVYVYIGAGEGRGWEWDQRTSGQVVGEESVELLSVDHGDHNR